MTLGSVEASPVESEKLLQPSIVGDEPELHVPAALCMSDLFVGCRQAVVCATVSCKTG